jgi:hypothetical protein
MSAKPPCPTCGTSGTRTMKFKIEDSGEYRVICEACHPEKINLDVRVHDKDHDGQEVKVADVEVTGRLDWTQENPLVEWDHHPPRPVTDAYAALEAPWYGKLARAFARIFRPNAVSDPGSVA